MALLFMAHPQTALQQRLCNPGYQHTGKGCRVSGQCYHPNRMDSHSSWYENNGTGCLEHDLSPPTYVSAHRSEELQGIPGITENF